MEEFCETVSIVLQAAHTAVEYFILLPSLLVSYLHQILMLSLIAIVGTISPNCPRSRVTGGALKEKKGFSEFALDY